MSEPSIEEERQIARNNIVREWIEDHGCYPNEEEIQEEYEYIYEKYKYGE